MDECSSRLHTDGVLAGLQRAAAEEILNSGISPALWKLEGHSNAQEAARLDALVASARQDAGNPHLGGRHVALPGFADLQLNGAFGHDITTDPSKIWSIGERLLSHGVTAFLPTVITSPPQQRRAAYDAIRSRPAGYRGAMPLGLHIEGPELAPDYAGVHPRTELVSGCLPSRDGTSPRRPADRGLIVRGSRRGAGLVHRHGRAGPRARHSRVFQRSRDSGLRRWPQPCVSAIQR